MIKVAVSGWNGFIGQNLDKALRKAEYSVVSVPRNIFYNMPEIIRFFDYHKPEFIIHTAAYGNKYDQMNDLETIYANIIATINLLEMTRDIPYKGFINVSSSSVMLPYETFYSATKSAGEQLVKAFVNKYNKPVFSVRPFTVIGKGEQSEHLIPTLIRSCRTGEEMPFVADSVHDYIGVTDLCSAILFLMQYAEQLKGENIDIGTGKGTTNKEIKELIEAILGQKARIKETQSLRPYDTNNWIADTTMLEYLGWLPSQTIEGVIKEMV